MFIMRIDFQEIPKHLKQMPKTKHTFFLYLCAADAPNGGIVLIQYCKYEQLCIFVKKTCVYWVSKDAMMKMSFEIM